MNNDDNGGQQREHDEKPPQETQPLLNDLDYVLSVDTTLPTHVQTNSLLLKRKRSTDDDDNDDDESAHQSSSKRSRNEQHNDENSVASTSSNTQEEIDYCCLNVKQLKDLCRSRGLKVSGIKSELIARLKNVPPNGVGATRTLRQPSQSDVSPVVEARLIEMGVVNSSQVGFCMKRAILVGTVDLSGDDPMDNVVHEGACISCGAILKATVRDVLYQPDNGIDYESHGEMAAVMCSCGTGNYVTRLCEGVPSFDSGEHHNHCRDCPSQGSCVGNCREIHCFSCMNHYASVLQCCPVCGKEQGSHTENRAVQARRRRGTTNRRGDDCVIS